MIPTKEADLYNWADNFSTLLTANPTTYGLVAGDATAVAAVVTPFKTAFDAASDPGTRTQALVGTKDAAKDAMLAVIRPYYRMIQANVIAMSGRSVEAAGDVDVLLLDKTGTITLGNRQATSFLPAQGIELETLADAAQLASLADETPEGRSIVVLAKERCGLRERPNARRIALPRRVGELACVRGEREQPRAKREREQPQPHWLAQHPIELPALVAFDRRVHDRRSMLV